METSSQTKRTVATISLTINYGKDYLKLETQLNNENGISDLEIEQEGKNVKSLLEKAIENYKQTEQKEKVPTFDPDKNLEALLEKANRKLTVK